MKKIIAAFDSIRFSESTVKYAVHLAKQHDAHIVGIFLKESTRVGYAVYASMVKQSMPSKTVFDEMDRAYRIATEKAIADFENGCRKEKINFSIHEDKGNALDELLHETIFADLLIIDAWETFSYLENSLPGWFIKNILHHVNCPVLIVPRKFQPIKKLVFLYDGSPSSVQAIKMFNYVMPELSKLESKLLSAKEGRTSMYLADNKLLREWMKSHYPEIEYQVVKGYEKEIVARLKTEEPGMLVVAGAYHRSNISMWLHQSIADLLIKDVRVPVFIAHG